MWNNEDSDIIHIDDMGQFDYDDLEALLHKILNYVRKVTNADGGTIYLKENESLKFTIFQNNTFSYENIFKLQKPLKDLRFPIKDDSNIMAVQSFLGSKIISIDNIYDDCEYDFEGAKAFDKDFNYKTTSVLTIPLIDRSKLAQSIGVIQLINKKDKNRFIPFTQEDKEFLSLCSYLIVLSISTTKNSMKELKKLNGDLEKKVIERTYQLERAKNKLEDQANRDPMTNLHNRRYFDKVVNEIFPILQRGKTSMFLAVIDIDDFKKINDTYGHVAGDMVIKKLADIFIKTLRKSDIIIRFGGEEFIVILTNTNFDNCKNIIEKLRVDVENSSVSIENIIEINFTISVGVRQIHSEDDDINIALNYADTALYQAKSDGKNQICYK